MYNKIIIMGRLTFDPELRTSPQGFPVCSFSIAVDRRFTPNGQERKADFFRVTVWRQQAEFVSRYFHKGSMILVEGECNLDEYVGRDGSSRASLSIQADRVSFTGEKQHNAGGYAGSGGYSQGGNSSGYSQGGEYSQGGNSGGYSQGSAYSQGSNASGYSQSGGGYAQPPYRRETPAPQKEQSTEGSFVGDFERFRTEFIQNERQNDNSTQPFEKTESSQPSISNDPPKNTGGDSNEDDYPF